MPEASTPAPAPASPTPAQPAAQPPTPAAPAPPSRADLIAAATRALHGEPPAPAEVVPPSSPLPSTPEAPATQAVLAAEDTAQSLSSLIRQRNELADAVQAFEAERAKMRGEASSAVQQARAQLQAELREAFERDPQAFLSALQAQRDPLEIARELYLAQAKLEDLPPEQRAALQAERELRQLRRDHERMRAEIQQAQAVQALQAYRGHLAQGMRALDDSTPLVKELAAENPGAALALMENLAGALAQSSPEIGIQSAAQLAARLELTLAAELRPFEKLYERRFKPAPPAAAAAQPQPARAPAPTITPSLSDATPARLKTMTAQERIALAAEALRGK